MNEDWCLFIYSSLTSLKAALICQKYNFPTIPVAYCHIKEDRESIKETLNLLKCNNLNLPIVADMKVINYLLGLKSGCAKYPCLHCEFDSRNSLLDYDKNFHWPEKESFSFEQLVSPEIRSLINDENFEKSLNMLEMVVWHSYKELHKNVFGKMFLKIGRKLLTILFKT